MTIRPVHFHTTLGIAPATRGFGFAVLEARGRLVAWGVAHLYSSNREEFLQRLVAMMERYRVGCLCIEEPPHPSHGERTRGMLADAVVAAQKRRAAIGRASRYSVRQCLGLDDSSTKHAVASRLAEEFAELLPLLPAPRRPWETEDRRMKVFEALGLAVANLRFDGRDDVAT